jgi:hypothetical protein
VTSSPEKRLRDNNDGEMSAKRTRTPESGTPGGPNDSGSFSRQSSGRAHGLSHGFGNKGAKGLKGKGKGKGLRDLTAMAGSGQGLMATPPPGHGLKQNLPNR